MHWKAKAVLRNVLARLPHTLSHAAYYQTQRRFGGLRRVDPKSRLRAAAETWRRLANAGADPVGKTFFEIGTGRMVTVPLAYWLMGAERTVTVDLNRYLKPELVRESLQRIAQERDAVETIFGGLVDPGRLDRVSELAPAPAFDCEAVLREIGVEYHAPGDAARTGLPDASIDFHTSFTVLEHIPPAVLAAIFAEATRVLKPGGLLVHGVDYSDHFSHSDPRITAVNFLRYSGRAWDRWSGNRYMYMNRLRHADYLRILRGAGHELLDQSAVTDQRSLALLESGGLPLSEPFRGLPAEELAKTSGWFVATRATQARTAAA
ncbi:MAG: methyltransferase domain-containing protein [Planctomycetota bacterium]